MSDESRDGSDTDDYEDNAQHENMELSPMSDGVTVTTQRNTQDFIELNRDELMEDIFPMNRTAKFAVKMIGKARCLQGYEYVSFLGSGVGGVACAVRKDGIEKVVKVMTYSEASLKEVTNLREFQRRGIGVKYIDHCSIKLGSMKKQYILILMEKLDGTLFDLIKNNTSLDQRILQSIGDQLIDLIRKMRKYKISHGDMHVANIGYIWEDEQHSSIKLKLLDMGLSDIEQSLTDRDIMRLTSSFFERQSILSTYLQQTVWIQLKKALSQKTRQSITDESYDELDKIHSQLNSVYLKFKRRDTISQTTLPGMGIGYMREIVDSADCLTNYTLQRYDPFMSMGMMQNKLDQTMALVKFTLGYESGDEANLAMEYYGAHRIITCNIWCGGAIVFPGVQTLLVTYLHLHHDLSHDKLDFVSRLLHSMIRQLKRVQITCGNLTLAYIGVQLDSSDNTIIDLFPFDFSKGSPINSDPNLEWYTLGKSLQENPNANTQYIFNSFWLPNAPRSVLKKLNVKRSSGTHNNHVTSTVDNTPSLSKRHGSEVSTPPKTSKRAKGTIQKKEGFIRF